MNKYNNTTSIRFDEDVKTWLYRKMQVENRSLGNLVNTILKREIERNDTDAIKFKINEHPLIQRIKAGRELIQSEATNRNKTE